MSDYWLGNELMRWPRFLLWGIMLLLGLAALPVRGEQVTYYVWTDDQGVIHAEDTPPTDYDYQTRTIEVPTDTSPAPGGDSSNTGALPSSGTETGGGNAPSPAVTPAAPTTDADRAIADEEEKRLEQDPAAVSGGAETAPGAEAASPSSTAPSSQGAAGSTGAQGAATAPGAVIAPPVIGP